MNPQVPLQAVRHHQIIDPQTVHLLRALLQVVKVFKCLESKMTNLKNLKICNLEEKIKYLITHFVINSFILKTNLIWKDSGNKTS